jgi:IS4 transposase
MRRNSAVPHHNTVFRQVTQFIPWGRLAQLIEETGADKGVSKLGTKGQLLAMIFAQLAGARGLRDIEALLESHAARRYHAGLPRGRRSTLADANSKRPSEVFTGLFSAMVDSLERKLRKQVGESVYLIDSTLIKLNELSEWSRFSADLLGVKAHIVYDAKAERPTFFAITPARTNDIIAAWDMPIDPGATYVFDLGYYHYRYWAALDEAGCRFVTRLKSNTPLRIVRELKVPEGTNILSDRIGFLPERQASNRHNPMDQAVREIRVTLETGKEIRVVTNDLDASATEIADLYRRRWAIELFFRWVKQTLKIGHFHGTSENAVRIQIAVALITFLLIKMAHAGQAVIAELTRFARLISANLMHRRPLERLRPATSDVEDRPVRNDGQMTLQWA